MDIDFVSVFLRILPLRGIFGCGCFLFCVCFGACSMSPRVWEPRSGAILNLDPVTVQKCSMFAGGDSKVREDAF